LNIAVLVKLAPDTEAALKIDADRLKIATVDINYVLNPYDEYAVEEGLRWKEKFGGTTTVFSLGREEAVKALRNALAMGADEAVHIVSPGGLDMLGKAKALAAALQGRGFDVIFAGKQSVDDDCGAVGPMTAYYLSIPHISTVVKLDCDGSRITAWREFEGGAEKFECPLPVLITAQKGLNEPRYASLKGIMFSKKKEIAVVEAAPAQAKIEILKLNYPPVRQAGKIVGQGVEAVPKLLQLLREEAKVL